MKSFTALLSISVDKVFRDDIPLFDAIEVNELQEQLILVFGPLALLGDWLHSR